MELIDNHNNNNRHINQSYNLWILQYDLCTGMKYFEKSIILQSLAKC
jgi:hypothetical protein